MGGTQEFEELAAPYRRELLAFCHRMLGSADEAEDLVQETYLRAWRAYGSFEHRSSVRTWLYRIATNACLSAAERRARRPLPSGLGSPAEPGAPLGPERLDIPWLQPFPGPPPSEPGAVVAARGSLRLALVAALQYLPPRQRAVLILRDVLALPAAEVAGLLGSTTPAVKSALQRARATLAHVAPAEEELAEPAGAELRALLDAYVSAFERADLTALLRLLRADVTLEMPPFAAWFAGRAAVGRFLAERVFSYGSGALAGRGHAPAARLRLLPVEAGGQPAFATLMDGEPHGVQLLEVTRAGIAGICVFLDSSLATRFLSAATGVSTP
ncbi:RNA polymerase subunit sigma-70 [Streptomyces hoynatensis]|uniref:RNA polymerase sigma factor n=1 Tax=Streptomyces hoynatensis TaxID=1141874 RepID=A0A3A9YRP1_9ACTN|nr:RNA polymerase subunit sigma-70 [Streptomyces hoynatensis]RKN37936.1 sigma-70 family RNA polymerase sigma factor [Streptomyces hoynatensis]